MFCPKCAAQNLDGASFCRVCGANISLIPQCPFRAVGSKLPRWMSQKAAGFRDGRRRRGEPSLESAIRKAFHGNRISAGCDRACIFTNGNGMVVLDAHSRVFDDGYRLRAVHSRQGTRETSVSGQSLCSSLRSSRRHPHNHFQLAQPANWLLRLRVSPKEQRGIWAQKRRRGTSKSSPRLMSLSSAV